MKVRSKGSRKIVQGWDVAFRAHGDVSGLKPEQVVTLFEETANSWFRDEENIKPLWVAANLRQEA